MRSYRNLGLNEVLVFEPDGTKHRSIGSTVFAVDYDGRKVSVATDHDF